jgi:PTS system beta-glucosides-specific IIC component
MGKYNELAKVIIKNVGGKENISGLAHCVTRLRFVLKDESKGNDAVLKQTDGVVTVVKAGGQYQVVIGNHVPDVYEDVIAITGTIEGEKQKMNLFDRFVDIISGVFAPFLPMLCCAGILQGFNALFIFFELYQRTDGIYIFINSIGDAVFRFFPVIIGFSAAKKFGLNQMTGILLGLALCYPTIQKDTFTAATVARDMASVVPPAEPLGQLFGLEGLDYYFTILGVPVVANNYLSTVIPVILVVALAAPLERLFKKVIPDVIATFFVPLCVLVVSLAAGLILIGPIVAILTNWITAGAIALSTAQPIIFALVLGTLWQVLVMFGLHWALVPMAIMNFTTLGYDYVMLGTFPISFAQTAVIIALYFKIKDKKQKAETIPVIFSGICGVTEPAIYGFSLPRKIPFIFSCIAGGIGAGVFVAVGYLLIPDGGAAVRTMGGMGIFGLPSYINSETNDASGVVAALIGVGVAMLLAFILTFFFYKEKEVIDVDVSSTTAHPVTEDQVIIAPVEGKIIPLAELKDQAFAEGLLGKGVGIEPTKGEVVAPFDGEVTMVFPTLHAIGVTSNSGLELLIHIGIDTVKLDGKYFKGHVKQGDKVKQGQLLVTFDIKGIESEGYNTQVPVIVTNTPAYTDVVPTREISAGSGTELLTALV